MITGSQQVMNPHIDPDVSASCRKRFFFHLTGKTDVPFIRLSANPNGFDLAFQRTMPAHAHPANSAEPQSPSIQLKPVPVFFQPITVASAAALETGITGSFTSFHPPKECLERFVQILDNNLQNVAVKLGSKGVFLTVLFHFGKLLELAYIPFFIIPGQFPFLKANVIPSAARFNGLFQQMPLRSGWI
jgi:hypothetical protein